MTILTTKNKKEEGFLRKKVPEINFESIEDELKDLVKKMREIMKKANGIGLSANQIGLSHRLFVAQVPDANGHIKFYAYLNPVITKPSKDTTTIEEGCLSVPNTFGPVERPHQITLEALTIQGKKIKIKAWGLLARVFQHEVDHLNGALFTDKCTHIQTIEKNTTSSST